MTKQEAKLRQLMEEHPRLSTRKYAQMAVERGIVEDIDPSELVLREIQKDVRKVARVSKDDPEQAFVSLLMDCGDGVVEEGYVPARACTEAEAQRVLDDYAGRIEGTVKRAAKLYQFWSGKPYGYQLTFPWG